MLGKDGISLKGKFLISGSALLDPNFNKSVVFILEHNKEGAFGLVLNRFESINLSEAVDELPQNAQDIPLFWGGPVEPQALFFLYENIQLDEQDQEIIPNVYWGSSEKLLMALLQNELAFRVFHGYAGWDAGQLETEIAQKSWIISHAQKEVLLHEDPLSMWRNSLSRQGGIYDYFAKKVNNPRLN